MDGLKAFGLSDNEISVFLQLLKNGSQSIWQVSIKTGIKRTSTYDIIKGLIRKDLVLIDVSGKKNLYRAVDPDVLLEQYAIKKDSLKDAVKKLKQLEQKTFKSTKMIRYTGVSGIRTVMGLFLLDSDPIYGYGSNKLSEKLLSFYPENFAQKRIDSKIKLNAIIEPNQKFYAQNNDFEKYTTIRNHPLMKDQEIVYFLKNGRVAMLKLDGQDPEVIFIEDKKFYNSQKKIFDYLWENAKK